MSHALTSDLMRAVDRWLGTDTPGPLTMDLHELEHRIGEVVAPLEAIVGDLATGYGERGPYNDGYGCCALCGGTSEHEAGCEWRRAVEWVRGQEDTP